MPHSLAQACRAVLEEVLPRRLEGGEEEVGGEEEAVEHIKYAYAPQ